jgi:hypothetical protein
MPDTRLTTKCKKCDHTFVDRDTMYSDGAGGATCEDCTPDVFIANGITYYYDEGGRDGLIFCGVCEYYTDGANVTRTIHQRGLHIFCCINCAKRKGLTDG